jgi:hypothetical protein
VIAAITESYGCIGTRDEGVFLGNSGSAKLVLHCPACLHSFKNESGQPAKMLISVAPAGLEQMFFEVGQPVEPGATAAPLPTKADIEKLLTVAPRYGIEIRVPHHD